MKLGIVGGRLQGTEAAYLARKAGYGTIMVDRRPVVPAMGLVDQFHCLDVRADPAVTRQLLFDCDAVLPACEDLSTLQWLSRTLQGWDMPLLFDIEAYRITSSKLLSDAFLADWDVPRPRLWPDCRLPVIVKPDCDSGSQGVSRVTSVKGLRQATVALEAGGHRAVVQEFVEGASVSVEVVAVRGRAVSLQVTELEFDDVYDCKRVLAPAAVSEKAKSSISESAVLLAQALGLTGIMDVEAMVDGDVPRVIEMDARLPSQTPTAVYHSTGVNMVEVLVESLVAGRLTPLRETSLERPVVYQHVAFGDGLCSVTGEAVISKAGPLRLVEGLFGADEALTDYAPDKDRWLATLIFTGSDVADAIRAADECLEELRLHLGRAAISRVWDPYTPTLMRKLS